MASHPIDFLLIGNDLGTAKMREVWSGRHRLAKQIEGDVVLARVEGERGVIPALPTRTRRLPLRLNRDTL